MKHRYEFLLFALFISLATACGEDINNTPSADRGSIAFNIELQDAPTASDTSLQLKGEIIYEPILRAASIDCTGSGINTIQTAVYNSSNSQLASEAWSCSAHAGNISVPVGSGYKMVILGKDSSGNVKYRGEKSGITVTGGQTTDAGTITVSSFVPILKSPANNSIITENPSFTWTGSGASYRIQVSTNSNFSTVMVDTTTISTLTLPAGTYYWRVRAIDSNNNEGAWSNVYSFTVMLSDTNNIPIDTDTTAPSSPFVSINSGATSTTSTSVTLSLSATDNVGVTGYYASETSTTPSANASGWTAITSTTSYSANVSFTLSSVEGTKTVYVWFRDTAGNVSSSASSSITLEENVAYEVETNNGFSDPQNISVDTTYFGLNNDYEDYFKIVATGSKITVNLMHVTQNASGSDFMVFIYSASYSEIANFKTYDGVDNSITTGAVSGQPYYIKVYNGTYSYSTYWYELRVSFGNNVENYEVETNNGFSDPQNISVDTTYFGLNNDYEDYFKIVATGSKITVNLMHVTQNASGSDFMVFIYSASYSEIANFKTYDGVDNSITTGAVSGQPYYIKVYNGTYSYSTYWYELRVNFS